MMLQTGQFTFGGHGRLLIKTNRSYFYFAERKNVNHKIE